MPAKNGRGHTKMPPTIPPIEAQIKAVASEKGIPKPKPFNSNAGIPQRKANTRNPICCDFVYCGPIGRWPFFDRQVIRGKLDSFPNSVWERVNIKTALPQSKSHHPKD